MSEYSNTRAKKRAQTFLSPQELIKIPVSLDIEGQPAAGYRAGHCDVRGNCWYWRVYRQQVSVMWAERCLCTDNVLIVAMRKLA